MLASPLAAAYCRAARAAPPSRITRIETVYWKSRDDAPFWPHWTWVKLDADSGVSGIGETYPRNPVEAAAVHAAAESLIGRDPRDIERIWADLYRTFDYQVTGGAEMRTLSAIDLALWDLLGKHLEAPVYRLLGGKTNSRVRLYNTCFPYKYDFNREPEKIMRQPAALAFTSPRDGDGKTSLMVGIAPELAKRTAGGVLVVDADFHKPDLIAMLALPFNRTTAGPALIYPTNHPGLNVLLPASQGRGLDLAWLVRLREDWPLVLVDLPSLEHAEAASLLCQCTGVYLTVRLGHTARPPLPKPLTNPQPRRAVAWMFGRGGRGKGLGI